MVEPTLGNGEHAAGSSDPWHAGAPGPVELADPARAASARRLASRGAGVAALDQLADLAAQLLGVPSAQVSLVSEVQNVMAGAGFAKPSVGTTTPAGDSLCTVTVAGGGPLVVTDAATDERVAGLPPVTSGAVGAYLGVPLLAEDGHVVGALCVFTDSPRAWQPHDVALLQRLASPVIAELELAALSADYESGRLVWQLAVEAAGIGAFDWDLVTDELKWDDRTLELFGLDRGTFGGTIEAFTATVHPDDRSRVTEALDAAVESCGSFVAEYRVLIPDGSIRWVGARGRALRGEGGQAVRFVGAAFDNTTAREGEARVARVLEAMPTAFYHLDDTWRFDYVNAEAERLLGTSRESLMGELLWDLFPSAADGEIETYFRRAVEEAQPVAFDSYYPAPLDGWFEIRAWPTAEGLSVYFNDVSDRYAAQHSLERSARRAALVSGVAEVLLSTLDGEDAIARLAPLVVPELADWCLATLVDDEVGQSPHGLRDVGCWHADPESLPLVERYGQIRLQALTDLSFIPTALNSPEPTVLNQGAAEAVARTLGPGEARELTHLLAPEAVAVVRLRGRDRTLGLLTVFRGPERAPFTDEDLETLRDVAARAGLALDNARLFTEQRDLAEGLQRSLLTPPPEPDHLQIVVRYEPAANAAQVGGDWYDSFIQPTDATMLVIGDVVGHDTAAAAAMGQVRSLLRGVAVYGDEGPAQVLQGVDRVMATLKLDTTATAVVARLEQTPEEKAQGVRRLRWSNAGHPPPLVIRPDAGVVTLGGLESDLLLGLDPATGRQEHVTSLEAGATVLLYTDGLVERRSESLDEGLARLTDVLVELASRDLTLDELCDQLIRRMLPDRPEDDVALVAVRVHPEDRPRPPEAGPSTD